MSTETPTPTAVPSATGRRHTGDRNQNGRISSQFIPKTPGIEILGTSTEQRGHDFANFLKSIHHHALTTFRHSKDISSAILEFKDPLAVLRFFAIPDQGTKQSEPLTSIARQRCSCNVHQRSRQCGPQR